MESWGLTLTQPCMHFHTKSTRPCTVHDFQHCIILFELCNWDILVFALSFVFVYVQCYAILIYCPSNVYKSRIALTVRHEIISCGHCIPNCFFLHPISLLENVAVHTLPIYYIYNITIFLLCWLFALLQLQPIFLSGT